MADAPHTPAWQRALTQAWTQRGPLARLLWPVAMLYGLLVALRRRLYRAGWLASARLPVPLIVVGNVVVGGAGKTPVVIALVEHLQRRGIRVGVIARGYGRSSRGCLEVHRERRATEVGDEAALIQRRTGVPVFVAEQRLTAGLALLAHYPQTQVVISDDGLQHLALQRDLEIGVFDDRGIGNGWLLPAGPLREPWPRPLDLLLHTGTRPAFTGFWAPRRLADHALRADGSQVPLTALAASDRYQPLLALAAIARPEAFFAMLRQHGLTLTKTLALPDHHDFSRWSPPDYAGHTVICTEKDAVKLWPLMPGALAVPLQCSPPEAFWAVLDARLAPLLEQTGGRTALSSPHGHTTT